MIHMYTMPSHKNAGSAFAEPFFLHPSPVHAMIQESFNDNFIEKVIGAGFGVSDFAYKDAKSRKR